MQFHTAIGLLVVANHLCSALCHPTQKADETALRSVKTSSGRNAFESESSLSHTEIENDGHDSTLSYSSDYESKNAESNYSSTNSEYKLDSEHGDLAIAESNSHSESSTSSYSESLQTEFEREQAANGKTNSLDQDFEMSRSSKSEKSQKSSSSSDRKISIHDDDDDDDDHIANVRRKSSSSFTEEEEFESETKQSSFISKDSKHDSVRNGAGLGSKGKKIEEVAEEKHKLDGNTKSTVTSSTKQGTNASNGLLENSTAKGITKNAPNGKKTPQSTESKPTNKVDKSQKTSQKTSGAGECKNSSTPTEVKLAEKLNNEVKSQNDVAKSTVEKIQNSATPSQPLQTAVRSISESEVKSSGDISSFTLEKAASSTNVVQTGNLPGSDNLKQPVASSPKTEKPLIDTIQPLANKTPQAEIKQLNAEAKGTTAAVQSTKNEVLNVANNSPQSIQAKKVIEQHATSIDAQNSVEKIKTSSTTTSSGSPGACVTPSKVPDLSPPSLPVPSNSIPGTPILTASPTPLTVSAPIASSASNTVTEVSVGETTSNQLSQQVVTSNTQTPTPNTVLPTVNLPVASSTSNTITSASESTSSSEKQFTESSTQQYNASPEMYLPYMPHEYGSPYPPYPMYPYEKSPFLASSDQFYNGQSDYSSYLSQSANMNYYNHPYGAYPGYMPPYGLYGYPRWPYDIYGFYPFFIPPRCMYHPGNTRPEGCPEFGWPQTPSIPKPKSPTEIPCTSSVVPTTNNSPNCLPTPSASVHNESPLVDISANTKPRDIDIVGNSATVPENTSTTPSGIPVITENSSTTLPSPHPSSTPVIAENSLPISDLTQLPKNDVITAVPPPTPAQPQIPLSPSQELMISKHLPSYIIEDLDKRFEQAKIEILQKYIVYPEDMTKTIEISTSDQVLTYDLVILGTEAGGLSALKTLTDRGKRVLILDDARLPPSESYSAYNRLSLLTTPYITSYSAKAPKTDSVKKIYSPKIVGGALCYDLGTWDHGAMQKFKQWSDTCKSWSWEKISSYYRDLENVEDIGYLNGPINVSYNVPDSSLTHKIVQSFTEAGIHEVSYELDSARREAGLILLPSMYDNKASMNFAEKMFAEVTNKENLHMALGVQASKVIFESDRAVGVEVVTASGKTSVIKVAEELIIASGVVDTVKLLQHSGIGDASLLQQYQIPVVRDLPQVGRDALLYPMYPGIFIKCQRGALLEASDSDFTGFGYVFNETSMQTSLASSFYKAFLQVQGATESNIQINVFPFSSRTIQRLLYFTNGLFNFNQEMVNFVLNEVEDHDIVFLVPQLLDLEARAQISISGADYKAAPLIDTHLYESDKDMLMMQKTLSILKRISKSSVFKEIGGVMEQIPVSKCGQTKFSKEFNECSIRELTVASLHLTGGTVMGVDEKTSVVDEQLRLHGIQNVRLFSPAIIPNGVSADSAAISSVIGRYGADIMTKLVKKE